MITVAGAAAPRVLVHRSGRLRRDAMHHDPDFFSGSFCNWTIDRLFDTAAHAIEGRLRVADRRPPPSSRVRGPGVALADLVAQVSGSADRRDDKARVSIRLMITKGSMKCAELR